MARIAFLASEIAPFAKTGGLADVASALPRHLHANGHDVRVFMPLYASIDSHDYGLMPVGFARDLPIDLGPHRMAFSLYVGRAPESALDVYFVHCPQLYHRDRIYTGELDDHLRFALLTRAALTACQHMAFAPDIVHANDWHTALAPLYLRTLFAWDELFARAKTVLTIHNLAYQGIFPADVVANLGFTGHRELLYQDDLRAGTIGLLKTGILYADVVTTVSETYAREIQTEAFGMGLEGVLRARSSSVIGIVNGVDYGTWSPEVDPQIPCTYGIEDVEEGKAENKRGLLAELGLTAAPEQALFGIVSRLTGQKGFELLYEPMTEMLRHHDVRLAVLGTGEAAYQNFFTQLQKAFPGKVCYFRGYNERLAHWIEAASDFFLMPSRFEPCGLNQMYSLKYGTVPIVRKTGGLADTVSPWQPGTDQGTGIVFEHYDATGMRWALETALRLYADSEALHAVRLRGMGEDYSWQRQGAHYEALYASLTEG